MSNNWLLIAVEAICLVSILLWFYTQKRKKETPIKKNTPVHRAKCKSQPSDKIPLVQMESKKILTTSPNSYKCSCRRLLTEFDLGFERNLLGSSDPESCTCIICRAKKAIEAINKAKIKRKNIVFCLISILLTLAFIFLFIKVEENPYEYDDRISSFCTVLGVVTVFCWLCCDIFVVKSFGIEESDLVAVGSHFESKIQTDGTIKTEKVTEYSGGGEGLYVIFLFLSFPLWIIPYFLYLLLSYYPALYDKCPKEVLDAYNKTNKEVQTVKISPSEQREYKNKKKEYYEKVNKIRERYSAYGKEYVQSKINEIPLPYLTKTIGTTIYYIIEIDPRQNMAFLLYNEGYGACDISGKIVQNNYFVCYDESRWQEIWQRELSYDVRVMLDEYIEYLRH